MHYGDFSEDWNVQRLDGAGGKPVGQPRTVRLPYDAMIHEDRDPDLPGGHNTGYFPGGAYQYCKTFQAPFDWGHGRHVLEFEAVFHRSTTLLNGHQVSTRASGYATFHVDLDEHLRAGEWNTLQVLMDTSDQPNSRWYTGTGILRPVRLLTGGEITISPLGLKAVTTALGDRTADVEVTVTVANVGEHDRRVDLGVDVGEVPNAAEAAAVVVVPGKSETTVTVPLHLDRPNLWSPEMPEMTRVHAVLRSDQGIILDTADAEFGVRTVQVDAEHGLRINGETTLLRGACIHHDNGVLGGIDLPDAAERRVRILKEAGFNAIRSAHNPASTVLLDACDNQGMLVMDELTDAWYFPKQVGDYGLDFEDWWERDLAAMITRDVNHPSVIMYSIGNEIAETSQPRGIELNREMAQRCRDLDPTRPVTNGINVILNIIAPDDEKKAKQVQKAVESGGDQSKNMILLLNFGMNIMSTVMPMMVNSKRGDKATRDAFADLDVAGYNYAAGRYRKDAEAYPERVMVGAETNPPDLVKNWPLVKELDAVIGDFMWTGWDYLGEAGVSTRRYGERRHMYWPYPAIAAGEPVVDLVGHLQTQAYLNRIVYGLDRGPFLAVQPVNHAGEKASKTPWRSTNSVRSWAWEGCEGTKATVEVYADAARIRLLLGDRVLEEKALEAKDEFRVDFEVPWEPGELSAVAYDDAGREIGRDRLVSAGSGLRLVLEPETKQLPASGDALAFVRLRFCDADGVLRPLADREVSVRVTGAGLLAGAGSANPVTEDRYDSGTFTTFYGQGLVVVRGSGEPGEVVIEADAGGIADTVRCVLPVR